MTKFPQHVQDGINQIKINRAIRLMQLAKDNLQAVSDESLIEKKHTDLIDVCIEMLQKRLTQKVNDSQILICSAIKEGIMI